MGGRGPDTNDTVKRYRYGLVMVDPSVRLLGRPVACRLIPGVGLISWRGSSEAVEKSRVIVMRDIANGRDARCPSLRRFCDG